ncbi:hypothetical protein QUW50_09775, partial [Barnesiella viscericola]|nr:hypothetical protein [Barnesiella viscericola]
PRLDAASRNTCKFTRKIHFSGPRIVCGVTRFSTRYPEISGRVASLLFLLCHELDPALGCGVTRCASSTRWRDRSHAALCCMEGETFKEFDLVESDTNHNHEEIVENIEVYRCVAIKSMQ